jgi:hypothetical protein
MLEYTTNRLQWLQSQIAAGWRLEAPVLERSVYVSADGRASAFEFVLRHERDYQVIAIPDCPEVRDFLQEQQLASVVL